MKPDPLPVTRERIESALDQLAAYVADGVLTAEGIGPIWDRLERELARDPLHDRILARAGRSRAQPADQRTASASITSNSLSSDAPAP